MNSLIHLAKNNLIQDWVQLPTYEERKQWECKQELIVTSAKWPKKISTTKYTKKEDVK